MGTTTDSEVQAIAEAWLSTFGSAISSCDPHAVASTFLPSGWLRDVLTFEWDSRSLGGSELITAYLAGNSRLANAQVSAITIADGPDFQPAATTDPNGDPGVEFGFAFETPIAHGRGFARLRRDAEAHWKALAVFMMVSDLKGYEERKGQVDFESSGKTWTQIFNERKAQVEADPYVLIVGAGQAGLTLAARLNQMDVPALVLERNARVGDNWRKRYDSMALHTVKDHHQLLYQPFPSNWPDFTPRDMLADWFESYAVHQHIVYWTKSTITARPGYDLKTGRWAITVNRDGVEVHLRPAHLVFATGTLAAPRVPDLPGRSEFPGTVLHSEDFKNAAPFVGKHVVVVGAGNSAVDICQDLAIGGAASVTMIQRSASCVASRSVVKNHVHTIWKPGASVEIGDFKSAAMPVGLLRRMMIASQPAQWEREKELHAKLRKGGMALHLGSEGQGQALLVLEQLGGYWLDKGAADLIASGVITVKQGVEPTQLSTDGVVLSDGSSLEADAVIFATGYHNIWEVNKQILGEDIMNRVGEIYGLDSEGELRASYRQTAQPGLWFATGTFVHCRFMSKQLALLIKAIQIGILKQ